MPYFEGLVERKLEKHVEHASVDLSVASREVLETLPLRGGIYLEREILPDGGRGTPRITVPTSAPWLFESLVLQDGQPVQRWDNLASSTVQGEPLSGFKKAILFCRIAAARPVQIHPAV